MCAFLFVPRQVRRREFHLLRLYTQVLGRVALATDLQNDRFGRAPGPLDAQRQRRSHIRVKRNANHRIPAGSVARDQNALAVETCQRCRGIRAEIHDRDTPWHRCGTRKYVSACAA